jgi:hypothetical protein
LIGTCAGAQRHNSLLIVTFDENAGGKVKPIFTIIVGANVRSSAFGERLNHYRLLRTIEDAYGLPPLGRQRCAPTLNDLDELARSGKHPSSDGFSARSGHARERCELAIAR